MKCIVVTGLLTLVACRVDVSLGAPVDAGSSPFVPTDAGTCTATEPDSMLTTLDPNFGELRALAAHAGVLVAAFARDDGAGSVALSTGGAFVELARVGADPVSIAYDGAHAYVACQASAQVYRVRAGDAAVATLQTAVTSIAIGAAGRAFWTRPADDAVYAWSFAAGAPMLLATVARAQSIAERDGALYIAGSHSLSVLADGAVAPVKLADACGAGPLAIEGGAVLCVEDGTLRRVDLHSGAVSSLASGIGQNQIVVAARGRAFYRSERIADASIEAVPLDGVGGPTIVERVHRGPTAIATDGCGLYFLDGTTIRRRAL